MTESYMIEIDDDAVGVVVRDRGDRSFVFYSAVGDLVALDGQRFATPRAAEKAAAAVRRRSMTMRFAPDAGQRRPATERRRIAVGEC